ncbi:MAG: RdgB/HAM1 family non-canonical purine NTP pyrophosphatase [Anaerolineales bacterium]|nr:RdgB/HAM1 family non-canonical purine NTP pyrophosphatase [Anaerolineales bacterium]
MKNKPALLLASTNPGKLAEFRDLLGDLPARLLTPLEVGLRLQVAEVGESYAENASHKALRYASASGLLTLADDSGLEVEALGGLPGIRSARLLAQPRATDKDRRAALLEWLEARPRPWRARFVCVVAIAQPDLRLDLFEGQCRGEIIPEERGEHGFGYDPIFFFPELQLTMAELPREQKNRISHRARATLAARQSLLNLLAISL